MNRIKKSGFTLLEVVISMMIISIISVGIYTGYMIMIKQIKAGQVMQKAALEGKKVIETLQASSFTIPERTLDIGDMTFTGNGTNFVRYLNSDYEDTEDNQDVTEYTAKYIETITFTTAQAVSVDTSENINLSTDNNLNSKANKIYISRLNSENYISYWEYSTTPYDLYEDDTKEEIPLLSEDVTKKMELYVYLTDDADDSEKEDIEILDYEGQTLISTTKDITENLVINFSNYKNEDGTLPSNENIEINIYNKTSNISNVYIEKQTALDVDIQPRKGEINVYNNRAEIYEDIGTLYNIKVSITDKDSNTLFTGYYKKNIH